MDAPIRSTILNRKSLKIFALATRITVICLQIVWNFLVVDHDAGVFNPPIHDSGKFNVLDRAVVSGLEGLRRWDAVYFMHISQHGYTYENCLAFFPLYPLSIRAVGNSLLYPFQYIMSYFTVLLISSVIINLFLFVKTAETLYKLGLQVTGGNEYIAHLSALLFCINPASIFMTAAYSETLYMYLSLQGMLKLEQNNKMSASVYFGLSCCCRSNGLLNLGYLVYKFLKDAIPFIIEINTSRKIQSVVRSVWDILVTCVLQYSLLLFLTLIPFFAYQYYCYNLYCLKAISLEVTESVRVYGISENLHLYGDQKSSWCNDRLPLAYSYIQSHYWDQGLFRYWKLKQIPNFLLALPVTILAVATVRSYYQHNRYICWTLGLDETRAVKQMQTTKRHFQIGGCCLLPYIVHLLLLTIFGWMFIHVQVLTRLLFSSTPVLYWFSAQAISMATSQPQPITVKEDGSNPTRKFSGPLFVLNKYCRNILTEKIRQFGKQDFSSKILLAYFLSYFVIGTAMFSNFLPWT